MERQPGQHDMANGKTAILQRAEQPETRFSSTTNGFAGKDFITSAVRRPRPRLEIARPAQNENQEPRIAAGDREQRELPKQRAAMIAATGKRVGSQRRQSPRRDHQDPPPNAADCGRAEPAEGDASGICAIIPAMPHRTAREIAPIAKPQNRARQPDFLHDHLLYITARRRTRQSTTANGEQAAPGPIPSEISRQQHDKHHKGCRHARPGRAGHPLISP